MAIGEAIMPWCSEVYIVEEFASFFMLHLMQVFGESFEAGRDLYINGLQEEELFCANR